MDSTNAWDLYNDMNLYITLDNFFIEPNGKDDLLIIGRLDNTTCVQEKNMQLVNIFPTRRICGVIGTIHLLGGNYLIVATHRYFIGIVKGASIWRLAGYDIIPYISNSKRFRENESYLQMLRKTLDTHYFYFSYNYDLSHTLQRQNDMPSSQIANQGLFERADERFIWNGNLLRNFNCSTMDKFQLPLILGFVSINQVQVFGQTFFYNLVSRRSIQRAGTRLFCRGINEDGHVANYVETEQIIEFSGQISSFVQTRGSMPFFWHQLPNLRYKPSPLITSGRDHIGACTKHFKEQIALYGRQVAVNLIDHKGYEGDLEEMYKTIVSGMPNVRYEAFDFHKECKNMKWHRLNILIDRLAQEQDDFSVFVARENGSVVSKQCGVFRTNCMDCLDRTNVVQSLLARRSLSQVLQKYGILQSDQNFESSSTQLAHIFNNIWADNADLISLQYAGTGALKTDFTRHGKRTKTGAMHDGVNSVMRYYLNNFNDGFRQDSIDLFLGLYNINDYEGTMVPSPLIVQSSWRYNTFPSILLFAVAMFFITVLFPTDTTTEYLVFMLFWGAMIAVSATGILHYGIEFVQWPRLFPPIKFQT